MAAAGVVAIAEALHVPLALAPMTTSTLSGRSMVGGLKLIVKLVTLPGTVYANAGLDITTDAPATAAPPTPIFFNASLRSTMSLSLVTNTVTEATSGTSRRANTLAASLVARRLPAHHRRGVADGGVPQATDRWGALYTRVVSGRSTLGGRTHVGSVGMIARSDVTTSRLRWSTVSSSCPMSRQGWCTA